jgi:hypothetical protein
MSCSLSICCLVTPDNTKTQIIFYFLMKTFPLMFPLMTSVIPNKVDVLSRLHDDTILLPLLTRIICLFSLHSVR